jgi:hypothetical protein
VLPVIAMTIQCLMTAWVLWTTSYHPNGVVRTDPAEAYETLAECRAAAKTQKADYAVLERQHKTGVLVGWTCLPDTVDPRSR